MELALVLLFPIIAWPADARVSGACFRVSLIGVVFYTTLFLKLLEVRVHIIRQRLSVLCEFSPAGWALLEGGHISRYTSSLQWSHEVVANRRIYCVDM